MSSSINLILFKQWSGKFHFIYFFIFDPFPYTVYICTTLYKQTAGNQFSCNVYTHSTAKLIPLWKQLLLPGWTWVPADLREDSWPPCPSAGWKGPLGRVYPPFLSEESFPAWSGIGRVPFPGCGQASKQELLGSLTQTGWLFSPILQFTNRKENLSFNPIIAFKSCSLSWTR